MQDLLSLVCGALIALLVLIVSYWVVVYYSEMGSTALGGTAAAVPLSTQN